MAGTLTRCSESATRHARCVRVWLVSPAQARLLHGVHPHLGAPMQPAKHNTGYAYQSVPNDLLRDIVVLCAVPSGAYAHMSEGLLHLVAVRARET